ncbi:MAG: hypothetical protein RIE56_05655 [Amphiplicatus sp.]
MGKRDNSAVIGLNDAEGRPRIIMEVAPDGAASISFFDENGEAARKLTPNIAG